MLRLLDADESKQFRDFFRESDYTTPALQKRFGATDIPQLHLLRLYLLGIPLEPSRQNLLFSWFWIGIPIAEAQASEFIPEPMLQLFLKVGVLALEDGYLVSKVRISPFAEFLVVSDHAVLKSGTPGGNTILWPNPTTLLCYHLSIQQPVGRTLDLGTGSGILALAAASHSDIVIATDLNARAREFTLFNASLNGSTNVEFREGSAFEPVRGERFDLILANPPFFVTPSVRRVYSDNSMELDGFCRMLIREAPEHLNDGGYCQMLMEWVQVRGQSWHDRLKEWFAGLGCDAWVMGSYMRSASDYSMIRVMEDREDVSDPVTQTNLTQQWMAYFEDRGVEAIYGGFVVLRKRQGQNWTRIEELRAMPVRPFGEFVRHAFESRELLEKHGSDEELLAMRPLLPASARLHKQFAISPEGWKATAVDLQLGEGLMYSVALQTPVANFVALCDGKRTLAECADQTAAALGVDPAVVRRECCAVIRKLADQGMVYL